MISNSSGGDASISVRPLAEGRSSADRRRCSLVELLPVAESAAEVVAERCCWRQPATRRFTAS